MISAVRRRWSSLDNALKQMLFVAGCVFAVLHLLGLALGALTGTWALLLTAASLLGLAVALGGLMALATRLFPDES